MRQDASTGIVSGFAIGVTAANFAWDRFLPVFFGLLLLLLILLLLARLWARRRHGSTDTGPAAGYEPPTKRLTDLPSLQIEDEIQSEALRVFCPHCGHPVRSGAQFCGSCGQSLAPTQTPAVCARCGATLRPGARFCGSCGTAVAS